MTDKDASTQIAQHDPFAAALEREDAVDTDTIMDVLAAFGADEVSPLYAEFAK